MFFVVGRRRVIVKYRRNREGRYRREGISASTVPEKGTYTVGELYCYLNLSIPLYRDPPENRKYIYIYI
jgi:hypothetical protein